MEVINLKAKKPLQRLPCGNQNNRENLFGTRIGFQDAAKRTLIKQNTATRDIDVCSGRREG